MNSILASFGVYITLETEKQMSSYAKRIVLLALADPALYKCRTRYHIGRSTRCNASILVQSVRTAIKREIKKTQL